MDKEERKLRRKDSRRDSSKKKLSTSENAVATMAGERIKTSSSVSRDNWFSYRSLPLPSTPPSLDTVSRIRRPWVPRLDIDVAFHASVHTLHFAFFSICSFNLAHSLRSARFASRGSQFEIIRPIFLYGLDVFLGRNSSRWQMCFATKTLRKIRERKITECATF